jgi:hypothetical protein
MVMRATAEHLRNTTMGADGKVVSTALPGAPVDVTLNP